MTQVVGKPTPRVEGELKVTGRALYSADLKLPNGLWGAVLAQSDRLRPHQAHRYHQGVAGSRRQSGDYRRGRAGVVRDVEQEIGLLGRFGRPTAGSAPATRRADPAAG